MTDSNHYGYGSYRGGGGGYRGRNSYRGSARGGSYYAGSGGSSGRSTYYPNGEDYYKPSSKGSPAYEGGAGGGRSLPGSAGGNSAHSSSAGYDDSTGSHYSGSNGGSPYYKGGYESSYHHSGGGSTYRGNGYYSGSGYGGGSSRGGIHKPYSGGRDSYVSSKSFYDGSSKGSNRKAFESSNHDEYDRGSVSASSSTMGGGTPASLPQPIRSPRPASLPSIKDINGFSKSESNINTANNSNSNNNNNNLDSARIWAKLLKLGPQASSNLLENVLGDISFKYKEKAFVEKFKNDLSELDEINKKLNAAYLAKVSGELIYENLNRIERNHKLIAQVNNETLEKIVNNEGEFGEYD